MSALGQSFITPKGASADKLIPIAQCSAICRRCYRHVQQSHSSLDISLCNGRTGGAKKCEWFWCAKEARK